MIELADRVLPYSVEAEQAVLGAVLAHGDLWPEAATLLHGQDFFRRAHQLIFSAMSDLFTDGLAIDLVMVYEKLRANGDLDDVGGPVYVSALTDGVPHSTNLAAYAGIVKEKARLRAAILAANGVVAAAYDSRMPSDAVIEAGVQQLLAISAVTATSDPVGIGTAVGEYIQTLDPDAADKTVIPTGFTDLDALLAGGVRAGELAIIAARPSVGKTSFGLQVGLSAAKAGHAACVFSLEMKRAALAARVLAWGAHVDSHRLRARMLGAADYGKLSEAWSQIVDVPLLIQDAAPSLTQVIAWCHRLRDRDGGLRCVVIDYLQLLLVTSGRSRHEDIAGISAGLKRLALDQDLAVIALSQLNRAPEGRTDKRPHLSDLRESGALEQDADVAILLFREEMHRPTDENQGIAEAILAKQRSGPTGVTRVAFLKEYAQFANLTHADH